MTISNSEREDLHSILDALINARNSLERIDQDDLISGAQIFHSWTQPRRDLIWSASRLIRRLLGPRLHYAELQLLFDTELEENSSDTEILMTLVQALYSFFPLFLFEGTPEHLSDDEVISQVMEDLRGIHWGDSPRFFSVQPRRQGQPKRPYRISMLRLSALNWDKYLEVVGMKPYQRHNLIAQAFKTDWDTIRKWARPIEDQYGSRSRPPEDIDYAKDRFLKNRDAILSFIKRDGAAYWIEKSAVGTGK